MKIDIIRIGNSHGIRIPKPILEQCNLSGQVDMSVENNRLVIVAANDARAGWNEAFQKMASNGDDVLLMDDTGSTDWDKEEWQW
jgi:antitoxin MazE